MPATISWLSSANSGPRWSIVGIAIACNTRSGTLVGPGICRKCRPLWCGEMFLIGKPLISAQTVEFGGVIVGQLPAHLDRETGHLALDRRPRIGPDTVGMRVVRGPQEMSLAEERHQRHRYAVLLEGRV